MAYASVSVEGGLFPSDLLDRIAAGDSDLPGQRVADFGLDSSRRLADEIQAGFSDARSYWDAFQRRLERSRESRTTLTREYWVGEFLELLGVGRLVRQQTSAEVGGERYFISHRAGEAPDAPPVHIVAIDQDLDKRDANSRRSPHALVQEYLNRSDTLWGVATNGRKLRLLRDTARLSKPTYLEFDLEGMIEGNQYSEFVLLYRLLHSSRFPKGAADAHESLLERYYQIGIDNGNRVREKLRDGVEHALRLLGSAFLAHPASEGLRQQCQQGRLDAASYYRQLLRLVYRFLFLMVAEERKLMFPPGETAVERQAIYTRYYGVTKLRERAERYFAGDRYTDLWLGLRQTFRVLRSNDMARQMGLSALNGELFGPSACVALEGAVCANEDLLAAVKELSTFVDEGGQRRRVNYAGLDVEEFGSVYESLLDFHPQVSLDPPSFDLVAGSERKQTGSYYTPPELVRDLIESALVPVIQDRLKGLKAREEKEAALLDLRVCDPASGSGHFLLAAARRIARELARVRTGEDEPSPVEYRMALRDVIRTCLYAVDKNPLAVDLCKVALWIEGHSAGLPLGFLDHHIKCGDSLVGVADLRVLEHGIPDDAYKPVTGDDKDAARYYLNRNREEKKRQRQLSLGESAALAGLPEALAREFQTLASLEELTPEDVNAKEALYDSLRQQGSNWWRLRAACDLWTGAFFLPLKQEDALHMEGVPTTGTLRKYLQTNAVYGPLLGQAVQASLEHPFFHWPLEFPDVWQRGGLDVVVGNPPWERIKLQEKEFFAARDREIAEAPNKAARERLIKQLVEGNPALWHEFQDALHSAEAQSKFIRASGRFPLTGRGDINTYSIFAETARSVLHPRGRVGMIVPSGIATDDTTKEFFADLVEQGALASLYDFENREGVFPGVHRSYKFCLLTLTGPDRPHREAEFAFFLYRTEQLQDDGKRFTLTPEDFRLINPNTLTCPIFRSERDSEITKAIYHSVPVLVREQIGDNPWGLSYSQGLFHSSNDVGLFGDNTQETLRARGAVVAGNVSMTGEERYVPLYEGRMVWQYDHRFGTYAGASGRSNTHLVNPTVDEYRDSSFATQPWYWVSAREVESRLNEWSINWFLGFRDVTNTTNERTVIASILPRVGVSDQLGLLFPATSTPKPLIACVLCNLNCFVLDYVARQKIGGTHLKKYHLYQLPVLPPSTYLERCQWSLNEPMASWIVSRVLELIYTSWDLQPFAQDLGYDGPPYRWDEARRFLLRCELDAAFFHLYGIERDDVDYIMDTFPIVKRRDEQRYGEYRTKRAILEIYDDMARAIRSGEQYRTRLDPPPADPRAAHGALGTQGG